MTLLPSRNRMWTEPAGAIIPAERIPFAFVDDGAGGLTLGVGIAAAVLEQNVAGDGYDLVLIGAASGRPLLHTERSGESVLVYP